jgi:murein L,D-transpeptidase YafK
VPSPAREIELGKEIHGKDQDIRYMIYVDKKSNKTKLVDLISSRTLYTFSSTDGLGGDGPKEVRGDKKTPEGIYCIDYVRSDNTYNPFYGTLRFGINYPNIYDTKKGRNGSLILICGTGIDSRIRAIESGDDFTYGAVVLKDSSIKKIYDSIKNDLDDIIVAIEDPSRKLDIMDYLEDIRERY